MKTYTLFIIFALVSLFSFGQGDSAFFIDEYRISVNETNLHDNNTNDGIGFGLGVYHSFSTDKNASIIIGLEYNRTVQEKRVMFEDPNAYSTNVNYYINSLSVPLSVRYCFGKKSKAFIEAGPYFDFNFSSTKKGTMRLFNEDGVEILNYNFYDKVEIENFNYGISFGVGLIIPVSKYLLIIKPEYKFGVVSLYDFGDQIFNKYFRIVLCGKRKF